MGGKEPWMDQQAAHPRGDLGKNIADADFPIVVGYELNGQQQSEIAYNQDELDDILDDVAPVHGGPGIPYSLDSLEDMEPQDRPVGAEIEQLSAGKKMKITKRLLQNLIREAMAADRGVELTQPGVDEAAISGAWPDKVYYNGESVFEIFYSDSSRNAQWSFVENEGYGDGQESYLGYDPGSDKWFMGFDVFADERDDYGEFSEPDTGGEMEGLVIELDGTGQPLNVMGGFPGGMYPEGLRGIKKSVPGIIDVRLD